MIIGESKYGVVWKVWLREDFLKKIIVIIKDRFGFILRCRNL